MKERGLLRETDRVGDVFAANGLFMEKRLGYRPGLIRREGGEGGTSVEANRRCGRRPDFNSEKREDSQAAHWRNKNMEKCVYTRPKHQLDS